MSSLAVFSLYPHPHPISSHLIHHQQLSRMKFSILALLPVALALPTTEQPTGTLTTRQSATTITDQLIFSSTLPQFTARRNARNPSNLDWSSDGCSNSPDNPFGFPFTPACHRHDFGYRNYKAQSRFTDANRLRIDDKFKADLKYQCSSNGHGSVCNGLADVYYSAVRAFGGGSKKREADLAELDLTHEELVAIYEEKVAIYNALVKEAQEKGELWTLD
ncbi:prokaryotic phospholipase A2-domain-containing protein [Podospora fimiseda]|uniref:Prokaryotic phospholipase A2-domain-containing protein n=1 Tax=Podospora fimiseda TaxID=252190 RepID=A0AAN7BI19_9PEZI|nr:prokaryotic phospholipase A2-domain-containing protein [Podospora fimiseda]